MDVSSGSDSTYAGTNYDRYELVSKTDTSVEFNIIANYFDPGTEIVTIKRFPVIFNKTDEGWRVAKHCLPMYAWGDC